MDIYQHVHTSVIDINKWSFLDNANTFKINRMNVQICFFGNTSLRLYLPLGQCQSVSTLVSEKNKLICFLLLVCTKPLITVIDKIDNDLLKHLDEGPFWSWINTKCCVQALLTK